VQAAAEGGNTPENDRTERNSSRGRLNSGPQID
jgi:hypothetical protein